MKPEVEENQRGRTGEGDGEDENEKGGGHVENTDDKKEKDEESIEKKCINVITMGICPTKISIKSEKKYRELKMKEIMSAICGLLNSNGGKLCLHFDRTPPANHITDCIRMIEQRVKELTTCSTVSSLTLLACPTKLTVMLKNSTTLVTLNYNLYLPTESQVMSLPSSEPIENVKRILQGRMSTMKRTAQRSHYRNFVHGRRHETMRESKYRALKLLKENPSKCVTIADRMTGKSNKFTSYISAFANHCGGHIYYGVHDDGIVQGERITERDKDEIIKKVTKAMNKMTWPEHTGGPQKGKHWEIYFEPVVDINCTAIPSTFVIVIYVARCPGGVFTEEPESYLVAKNCVEKMRFRHWMAHIIGNSTFVPPHVSRITWSSARNRMIYSMLTTRLIQYRNDNMMSQFNKLSELAITKYPESNAVLVVLSEKVAVALKYHHFEKAKKLLNEFEDSLRKTTNDRLIFEVRKLYLKSRIERAVGNYKESYKTAQDGIQIMQQIPAEFITVWFYMHAATLATILSSSQETSQGRGDCRSESKRFLEQAARDANMLDNFPESVSDLQQKLHIYMACVFLGCSLTGETIDKDRVTHLDMKAATSELATVHGLILNEKFPTNFRQVQFLFAQCDLFYRFSERSSEKEHKFKNLKHAFQFGKRAQLLARECQFEEMVHYANKRLANLTEKLIRNHIYFRPKNDHRKVLQDFDDYIENFNAFK